MDVGMKRTSHSKYMSQNELMWLKKNDLDFPSHSLLFCVIVYNSSDCYNMIHYVVKLGDNTQESRLLPSKH